PVLQTGAEVGSPQTVRVFRVSGPRIPVIRDVAGIGDRQLDLNRAVGAWQLDMNELGAVEKTHEGELVLRDVAPLDPVRDAAHTGAEVPAVEGESHTETEGQPSALGH